MKNEDIDKLKEGIKVLKFFNHRIRQELKNREKANSNVNASISSTPQSRP